MDESDINVFGSSSTPKRDSDTPKSLTPDLMSTPSRSTTPFDLCNSGPEFEKWMDSHYVTYSYDDEPWEDWPTRPGGGTFAIPALDRPIPPPLLQKHESLWKKLQELVPLSPDAQLQVDSKPVYDESELGIARNANVLYSTYDLFERLPLDFPEAALRLPINWLLAHVSAIDGGMHYLPETEISLPVAPQQLHRELRLAYSCTTSCMTSFVKIDVSGLSRQDAFQLKHNSSLHLLSKMAHPAAADRMTHVAVPEAFVEFKEDGEEQVLRQIDLDLTTTQLHRQRLGLHDRPVFGIAVNKRTVHFTEGILKDGAPTIKRFTKTHTIDTFEDWVAFYIFLMKIRRRIECHEPIVRIHNGRTKLKRPREESPGGGDDEKPSPDTVAPPSKKVRRDVGNFTVEVRATSSAEPRAHYTDNTPKEAVEAITPHPVTWVRSPVPRRPYAFEELLGLGLSGSEGLPLKKVHIDGTEGREML